MIQKKICMLGGFAVGKTSLVERYVSSIFSERYLSTVGVKVDKKQLSVDGTDVMLMLWDINGQDDFQDIPLTHLRGMAGYLLVVDGTRMATLETARQVQKQAARAAGDPPFILLLNKSDLSASWEIDEIALLRLVERGWRVVRTSAKTGDGVEEAFALLARAVLAGQGTHGTGARMTDTLLTGVLHALDLTVFERLPNGAFLPATPPPAWLAGALDAGLHAPHHSLGEALPFLDAFMPDAETAWRQGHQARAESGPFVTTFEGAEILLRAVALTIDQRAVLVIGRLAGIADARPFIQKARDQKLAHERLVGQIATLRPQHAALTQATDQLSQTNLSDDQRAAVAKLSNALDLVRASLDALPSPPERTRRGTGRF